MGAVNQAPPMQLNPNGKQTWYLQIQDKDFNVLYLNCRVGEYKKYGKYVESAVDKIVALFPSAHRWETRTTPYNNRVVM
jgi:hypothetical protein